jgi:hypothetical protein
VFVVKEFDRLEERTGRAKVKGRANERADG